MDYELLSFTSQLNRVLIQSEKATKYAVRSIDQLDALIDDIKLKSPSIDHLEHKNILTDNLNRVVLSLESFINLAETINKDELNIKQGPHGSIKQYIEQLQSLKEIENFVDTDNTQTDESFISLTLISLNLLFCQADFHLAKEFEFILKNYSGIESIEHFIDYLLNSFNHFEDKEFISQVLDSDDFNKMNLFIPNETVAKLEKVCSWLLSREQQYELYNDTNQHCDINEKLNFSQIRNEFLESLIQSSDKQSKREYLKSKLKSKFGKLFTKTTHKETNKAIEHIALFAEDLNFYLKILKHETMLIKAIFLNSEDTKRDLINKLTTAIIEIIQNEFENFFINASDFNNMTVSGDEILREIINLNIKVMHLKEKTNFLQEEDLKSASKFLNFSLQLNELTSNIFKNYLNSVKHGNFSSHSIRTNLSVHSFCVQTLQSLRIIHVNKNCLSEEILIAFTTQTDDNSLNDIESNEIIKYDRLTRRKKQLDQEPSSLYHFLIYYSDLIENLFHFLKEESVKIEESSAALNRITFMSSKTLNSFKNLL